MKLRISLLALTLATTLRAQEATPPTPADSAAPPAAPDTQPDWRLLSAKGLKTRVRGLLYASEFRELDAMIAEMDKDQLRFLDGDWKLTTFLDAVSYPEEEKKVANWKALFGHLKEWDQKSRSIYTGNAIGRTQLNYAYFLRTDAPSKDVKDEQWSAFKTGLDSALKTYTSLLEEKQKCPDMYAQLLRIGLAESWQPDKMDLTLQEAVAFSPEYYPTYQILAYYTLERWFGKPGASRAFLDSIPKMVPGDHGLEIYTRTAIGLYPYFQQNLFAKETAGCTDWATMKQGFEAILRSYPKSRWHLNLFAAYACLAQDRATARHVLDDITANNALVTDAWKPAGGFEAAAKWIREAQ